MPHTKTAKTNGAQERILNAAVEMFAQVGYNGTSTRDIADAADVNEVTIYRHYPKKRDLFNAALESELQRLTISAELVRQLDSTSDLHAGFRLLFQLISNALLRQQNLVRLLQFSALEIGADLEPLYRKYLGELLKIGGKFLERCQTAKEPRMDPYMAALVLAGAAISHHGFYQLLHAQDAETLSDEEASTMYATLFSSSYGIHLG